MHIIPGVGSFTMRKGCPHWILPRRFAWLERLLGPRYVPFTVGEVRQFVNPMFGM